ncbi:hypothetical protein [Flavobacterium sp. 3HN19-14]|uniref:hypothetical protein n=1 Tax=Flavobacterium sp. 3HN19-14 TaxID=3448133 RepID=UPI003EE14FAB
MDIDNDGITNCTESYGDKAVNLSATGAHTISSGDGAYNNNFTLATTGTGPQLPFHSPEIPTEVLCLKPPQGLATALLKK